MSIRAWMIPICVTFTIFAFGSQGDGQQKQDEKWISVEAGSGRFSDGTFLQFDVYEAVNGTRVSITRGNFKLPEAALKEMHRWLRTVKVVEKQQRMDSTGERAVGVFIPESGKEYTAILWTEGAKFVWLSSSSAEEALQMEKDLKTPFSSGHAKIIQ